MANDVKLQEGHSVDSNLRPIKVGGKSTSLEVAKEDARITGNLDITNDLTVVNDITLNGDLVSGGDLVTKVNGDRVLTFTQILDALSSDTGNNVLFTSCATFSQEVATFDATNTAIDFRVTNKYKVTLTNNVTNMLLTFPPSSGNFQILIIQDGTGGWDVTNWKAFDSLGNAANGSATVLWAGGSATTLTETANKADIISVYWDSADEKAYAVASENF